MWAPICDLGKEKEIKSMKIKRKVQKNLPQLIEWAKENEIKDKMFLTKNSYCVGFDRHGFIYFNSTSTMPLDQLFTVEIEEEITEETIIPKMLVVGRFDGYEEVYNQKLINFTQHLLSAYIIQDDGHMELIYDEEKGLVE